MRILVFALAAAMLSTAAHAADLMVTLRTAKGQAAQDAVVAVYVPGVSAAGVRFDWPYRMAQQNLKFDPFVLVVPLGASVSFPNRDAVRHQVYSFSPTHPFELKLYGKDETRSVRFDKAGVVALGCNIHDNMVAFIKVVDTPFAARSDGSGQVVLRGLPAGAVTLKVWHPYLKAPGNELSRTLNLAPAGGREALVLDLRTPPVRSSAY